MKMQRKRPKTWLPLFKIGNKMFAPRLGFQEFSATSAPRAQHGIEALLSPAFTALMKQA